MTTNKKGDIGLVKVMSDLVTKDYFIFSPISDTTCVDLIAANATMDLKRIQVKYCSLINGRMSISTSTVVNGKRVPVDLNKVDIWALYCPDNDDVYYIPIKLLNGRKNLYLRVENAKQRQPNIIVASDYSSLENAWNGE